MFALLVEALLAYYVAKRIFIFVKGRRDYGHLPAFVAPFEPLSMLGASLPTTWWNPGLKFTFRDRHSLYKNAPHKTFYINSLFAGNQLIYTASQQALRQVLAVGSDFQKPLRSYEDFQFLGSNVFASEGDTWKRHRRITAPSFNRSAYENVWETTAGVYAEITDKEGWRGSDEVHVRDMNMITHKVFGKFLSERRSLTRCSFCNAFIAGTFTVAVSHGHAQSTLPFHARVSVGPIQLALFVISICGFGIRMSWNEPPRDAQGRLSMPAMVFEIATSILIRSRVPRWAYMLGTEKLKNVDEAFGTFTAFMRAQIAEREAELKKLRAAAGSGSEDVLADSVRDVFGRLVNARLNDGKLTLSDEEIIGNCFIMVFAGHETTANTLSAAISMLGLYPEIQEQVYQSIVEVLGDREPTLDDFDKLDDVLCVFYEALRLYPAAYFMFRESKVDTTLSLPRQDNADIIEKIPLRKGTQFIMDFIGMGYDPQVFPEPEEFRPSRFSKAATANDVAENAAATSLDGIVNFSFGPRQCLGHKFAKVEGIAFLTLLLREWRVEVALKAGETPAMWRERVLEPRTEVTMSFGEVPVKLVRRRG